MNRAAIAALLALCAGGGCQVVLGLTERSNGAGADCIGDPSCGGGSAGQAGGGAGAEHASGGAAGASGDDSKSGQGHDAPGGANGAAGGANEASGGANGVAGASNEGAASGALSCDPPVAAQTGEVKFGIIPGFNIPPERAEPFSIVACRSLDIACEAPVDGPVSVRSGAQATLTVPTGFDGYFRISNPGTLPALLFAGRPVMSDTFFPALFLLDANTYAGLALLAGEPADDQLGLILVLTRDCLEQPLAGVKLESSKGGTRMYLDRGLPSVERTQTTEDAAALFVNAPIGTTVLSGHHESGRDLQLVSVLTQPRTQTIAAMHP